MQVESVPARGIDRLQRAVGRYAEGHEIMRSSGFGRASNSRVVR